MEIIAVVVLAVVVCAIFSGQPNQEHKRELYPHDQVIPYENEYQKFIDEERTI